MTTKTAKPREKKISAGRRRKPAPGRPPAAPGGSAKKRRTQFPEVKGKVLEAVELSLEDEENYISLSFADKTALHFDLEPEVGFAVIADYADWKTHNMRRIRKWPPFRGGRG